MDSDGNKDGKEKWRNIKLVKVANKGVYVIKVNKNRTVGNSSARSTSKMTEEKVETVEKENEAEQPNENIKLESANDEKHVESDETEIVENSIKKEKPSEATTEEMVTTDDEVGSESEKMSDASKENCEKSSLSSKEVENGEKDSESQAESEEDKKVFKLSVKKMEDLVTSTSSGFPNPSNGEVFNCPACLLPFPSEKDLEMHKSQMAHFTCTVSPMCATRGFSSEAELAAHNAETHPQTHRQLFSCRACLSSFPTEKDLEMHKTQMAHFTCSASQMCATRGFSSEMELAAHNAEAHSHPSAHPVQQMVQQVERLPYAPMLNQVQISPVRQPKMPNLPGIQVTKRPISAPDAQPAKIQRTAPPPNIRLPQSITLTKPSPSPKKDVANLLATRGTTVVASPVTKTMTPPKRRGPIQLNSSVSIMPSRPSPALPTVDLTKDDPVRRRPIPQARRVCQICDKIFPSQDALNAHVQTHRTQPQQQFTCNVCTAIYRSQLELDNHKSKFHPQRRSQGQQQVDMAIPVVDVAQPGVRQKLLQVGVRHVLRLSQLNSRTRGNSCFGLPIIPVENANNPAYCTIGDMGASNLLPLGQLESL